MSDRRVYPADVFSKVYIRLQGGTSYFWNIGFQPLSDEEISMMYLEVEITELIETIQRRHCK